MTRDGKRSTLIRYHRQLIHLAGSVLAIPVSAISMSMAQLFHIIFFLCAIPPLLSAVDCDIVVRLGIFGSQQLREGLGYIEDGEAFRHHIDRSQPRHQAQSMNQISTAKTTLDWTGGKIISGSRRATGSRDEQSRRHNTAL